MHEHAAAAAAAAAIVVGVVLPGLPVACSVTALGLLVRALWGRVWAIAAGVADDTASETHMTRHERHI